MTGRSTNTVYATTKKRTEKEKSRNREPTQPKHAKLEYKASKGVETKPAAKVKKRHRQRRSAERQTMPDTTKQAGTLYEHRGDATDPKEGVKPRKLIIHVCNDIGGWGRGFVVALSNRYGNAANPNSPEARYRRWHREAQKPNYEGKTFELGQIQTVYLGGCEDGRKLAVVNMIGQHDVKTVNGIPPVRYEAIRQCLKQVRELALQYDAEIHAPKFGAGLAGGDWNKIEQLLNEELAEHGVDVHIYTL